MKGFEYWKCFTCLLDVPLLLGQRLNRDFSCGFWRGEMYVVSGNTVLIPE